MRVDNKHTTVTEKGVSFIGTYEGCIILRSYYSIALRSNVFLGGEKGGVQFVLTKDANCVG